MKKYRKKPLAIEAAKWDGEKLEGRYPIELFKKYNIDWHFGHAPGDGKLYDLVIKTLEGEMTAEPGDYIIIGIQGEVYPCKSDIFEASYDEVKSFIDSDDDSPLEELEIDNADICQGHQL